MTYARIYKPSKTAMQSGKSKSERWVLEFQSDAPRRRDPLMGWTSGSDMVGNQVRLHFENRADAIAYARNQNIAFEVIDRADPQPVIKTYADNFSFRRRMPWTH